MSTQIQVGFKKVYLLIYDVDNGSREDCNIFYSPIELFDDPVTRGERIRLLENTNPDIGFRTEDLEVHRNYSFPVPEQYLPDDDHEDDELDEDSSESNGETSEQEPQSEPDDDTKLKPNQVLYHVELNSDHFGRTGFIPRVILYPKETFEHTGTFTDDEFELSVTLDKRMVALVPNVWQFNGTLREAESYLIGYGFVSDEKFSEKVEFIDIGEENSLS